MDRPPSSSRVNLAMRNFPDRSILARMNIQSVIVSTCQRNRIVW